MRPNLWVFLAWGGTACQGVPSGASGWWPPLEPAAVPVTEQEASTPPVDSVAADAETAPSVDEESLSEADAAFLEAYGGLLDEPDPEDPLPEEAPDGGAEPDRPVVTGVAAPVFGPRLLAVLSGTQPPRAVLSLADGREVVVEPGSMLADDGLVVLAVGDRAVEIAEIYPRGDRAAVQTRQLLPLYGSAPSAPSAERHGSGDR